MNLTPHCEDLASPSRINVALSVFILLGILLSYLPQHYRIIRRKSSEGISPYFVLLGTTSGTCALANILVLPTSRADVACCQEISRSACAAGLLGIAQVGVQWACFTVILLLFLVFFPKATPLAPPHSPSSATPSYRTALVVTATCMIHFLVTFVLSFSLLYAKPGATATLANVLGILATILSSIQYFPQLWTTFHLRAVGSLSIPMMCIQTPGSFVWAGSLAARLGAEGWSAWGVYVVTGTLQGMLLAMAIYFELKARRLGAKKTNDSEGRRGSGSPELGPHDTDDEGGHIVEGTPDNESDASSGHVQHVSDERTPLVRK